MGNVHPQTTNHPTLGCLQTVSTPQSPKPIYLKQYIYGDDYLLSQAKRKIKQRCSPHILQIYHTQCRTKHQLCSTTHTLQVYFEPFSHTLQEELSRRLKNKNNFIEKELLNFLKHTTSSLIALQQTNIKNVPLNTNTIVYCDTQVKVIDMFLGKQGREDEGNQGNQGNTNQRNEENTNCQRINNTAGTYLSPQLLETPFSTSSVKSDIFALGMILLEMITLDSLHGYYSNNTLDYDSLIHRVSKITHSIQMKTLLAEMLQYDPQQRIGLYKLQENISGLLSETRISKSRSSKLLKDLIRSHSSCDRKVNQSQGTSRGRESPRVLQRVSPSIELNQFGSSSSIRDSHSRKDLHSRKESPSHLSSRSKQMVNKSQKRIESTLCTLQVNEIQNDKQTLKSLVRNRLSKTNRLQKQNCEPAYNPFRKQETVYTISITKPNYDNQFNLQRRNTFGKQFKESFGETFRDTFKESFRESFGKSPPPLRNENQIERTLLPLQYSNFQLSLQSPIQTKGFNNDYHTSKSIDSPLMQNESKVIQKVTSHYSKISLPTGQSYEGQLIYKGTNPIREGNGILYDSQSTIIYSGAWRNDQYNGFGTIYHKPNHAQVDYNRLEQWVRYQGQFTNGLMHGFGTLYFSKGDKFAGCLKNGTIDGYGCFYKQDGTMITGLWSNGVYQQF